MSRLRNAPPDQGDETLATDGKRALEILDDDQYRALRFISFANLGGNRPTKQELMEWLHSPRPKPGKKGAMISPGRPAKYRYTGGAVSDALLASGGLKMAGEALAEMQKMGAAGIMSTLKSLDFASDRLASLVGTSELIEEKVPPKYASDIPAESFAAHLVRLGWATQDDHGGLGLTPLGRALLRSEDAAEGESGTYDVVVLDAHNDLSYPMLIQRLSEAGDALLIDPYLRVDQLLAIRAYTSISRVLVSARLKQEDRVAMAVLVETSTDRPLELRAAASGVLHDRIVIGDESAFTIGTSMNTIGRQHPTILTPLPVTAADAMRTHAERWWDDAEFLAAYQPATPKLSSDDEE